MCVWSSKLIESIMPKIAFRSIIFGLLRPMDLGTSSIKIRRAEIRVPKETRNSKSEKRTCASTAQASGFALGFLSDFGIRPSGLKLQRHFLCTRSLRNGFSSNAFFQGGEFECYFAVQSSSMNSRAMLVGAVGVAIGVAAGVLGDRQLAKSRV